MVLSRRDAESAPSVRRCVVASSAALLCAIVVALPGQASASSGGRPTSTQARAHRDNTGAHSRLASSSARQMVLVSAPSAGNTVAVLGAYQRQGGRWTQVFGPWRAEVGYNGVAAAGAKREGDGMTPSGSFGFGFFFGVDADPGLRYPYRQVTGPAIVWDDDPASPAYNEWVDTTDAGAGASPEPMYDPPAYDYGAVIDYNVARTPGLGSAIFLHVSTGGPTAGCVSLPAPELLDILRWLDPAQSPRIVIGIGRVAP